MWVFCFLFSVLGKKKMGSITDATILHHVCIVLVSLWCLNSFNCCHPVAYFLSLIYLYLVSSFLQDLCVSNWTKYLLLIDCGEFEGP